MYNVDGPDTCIFTWLCTITLVSSWCCIVELTSCLLRRCNSSLLLGTGSGKSASRSWIPKGIFPPLAAKHGLSLREDIALRRLPSAIPTSLQHGPEAAMRGMFDAATGMVSGGRTIENAAYLHNLVHIFKVWSGCGPGSWVLGVIVDGTAR